MGIYLSRVERIERQRETERQYADWVTRDEVLDELNRRGYRVSARALEYWQGQGWVDYPVRRWRNGATRALFPRDHVEKVVALIEDRLDSGHRIAKSKARVGPYGLIQRIESLERRIAALEANADG